MRKQFSRGLQTLGKSALSLLATGFLALWSTTIWTLLMHDSERPPAPLVGPTTGPLSGPAS